MKATRVLLLVAALAAAAWFVTKPDDPATPDESVEVAPTPSVENPPAVDVASTDDPDPDGEFDEEEPTTEEPPIAAPEIELRVRGLALRAVDRTPATGIVFEVLNRASSLPAARSAPSDGGGSFALDIVGPAQLGEVRLLRGVDAETGGTCFEGLVRLEHDFLVEIDELTRLHGRVVSPMGVEPPPSTVAIGAPPVRGQLDHRWIGRCTVDADGEFELYAAAPPREDYLRVVVAVGEDVEVVHDVARMDLASELGAEIPLVLGDVRFEVLDGSGRPIEGAHLRVAALEEGPRARATSVLTSSDGRAHLTRAPGWFEACIGARGFGSRVETFEFDGVEFDLEVRLERLETNSEIYGFVLYDSNEPAEGAQITVAPTCSVETLSAAGATSVIADSAGAFRLSAASNTALELTASHFEWGQSDPQPVVADGRSLVVWLPRTGGLVATVLVDALPGPFRPGGVEYALQRRGDAKVLCGESTSIPFAVLDMPAGEYDFYVLLPGLDAVAEGFTRVEVGQMAELVLAARPAAWFEGRVLSADGVALGGLRVVAHGRWSDEVAEHLGSGYTDDAGRFRVFGVDREANLVVRDSERAWAQQTARSGEPVDIRLP